MKNNILYIAIGFVLCLLASNCTKNATAQNIAVSDDIKSIRYSLEEIARNSKCKK